jgi:hypothetical protein
MSKVEGKPKQPPQLSVVDQERIKQDSLFNEEWLNKCYKKVALPNPACEKVTRMSCKCSPEV